MDKIKNYMRQMAAISPMHRFMMVKGSFQFGQACPIPQHKKKECFKNSTDWVAGHPSYAYFEGYVITPKLPIAIEHAWCTDPSGAVFDLTLRDCAEAEYCGVAISRQDLWNRISETGYYGVLFNGYSYSVDLIKELWGYDLTDFKISE